MKLLEHFSQTGDRVAALAKVQAAPAAASAVITRTFDQMRAGTAAALRVAGAPHELVAVLKVRDAGRPSAG